MPSIRIYELLMDKGMLLACASITTPPSVCARMVVNLPTDPETGCEVTVPKGSEKTPSLITRVPPDLRTEKLLAKVLNGAAEVPVPSLSSPAVATHKASAGIGFPTTGARRMGADPIQALRSINRLKSDIEGGIFNLFNNNFIKTPWFCKVLSSSLHERIDPSCDEHRFISLRRGHANSRAFACNANCSSFVVWMLERDRTRFQVVMNRAVTVCSVDTNVVTLHAV